MADSQHPMLELMIIGGSAGSLDVVLSIISALNDAPFPVVVVLHRKETNDNLLSDLFRSRSNLHVRTVEANETLSAGTIFLAPPDYHLLVEKDGMLSLDLSERINYSRPSIDVCFETAAEAFGDRLVVVLLSGSNADGTAGVSRVKEMGGITIVQDPSTAESPFMPAKAI